MTKTTLPASADAHVAALQILGVAALERVRRAAGHSTRELLDPLR